MPYSRHFSHDLAFLDYVTEVDGRVVVKEEYQRCMREVLRTFQDVKEKGTLLLLSYTTVNEYVWLLRALAGVLRPLGKRALFYLAAAVSDFHIPRHRMVEHKIQSGEEFSVEQQQRQQGHGGPLPAAQIRDGSLILELDPVPKFLKDLVDEWAPEAMIVSFKLETDPAILIKKARYALERYRHHLVIGNLLATRKWEVVFVSEMLEGGKEWIRVSKGNGQGGSSDQAKMADGTNEVEIEEMMIPAVKRLHEKFMAAS